MVASKKQPLTLTIGATYKPTNTCAHTSPKNVSTCFIAKNVNFKLTSQTFVEL